MYVLIRCTDDVITCNDDVIMCSIINLAITEALVMGIDSNFVS